MAYTYDPNLPTDMDWVRFLAGDRPIASDLGEDSAFVQDEEILALLAEEPNKYFAAAQVCDIILSRSGGLVDKQVGDLRLKWGESPKSAYQDYISGLRERGAYEMNRTNYIFKVL